MTMVLTFKVPPFNHQLDAFSFCENRPYYALLMEQGTGKTAVVIWDMARRWVQEQLAGALVMAPNGVHANWVLRELPTHAPEELRYRTAAWYSGANKREASAIEDLFSADAIKSGELRILTMNWESLNTQDGYEAALEFLKSLGSKAGAIGDESQRMKNPNAKRTKAMARLKPLAPALRGIMSGTPVLGSPWDAFSQFSWLHTNILQTTSYWAFKSEYAELLPPGHGLLRHIAQRAPGKPLPQIVARDPITGAPKWRNLDRLERLIDAHSFRVLKKDCLDLPEKIYTQIWFRMTRAQRQIYEKLRDEFRLQLSDGSVAPVARLGSITKMSQVISGYFLVPGTTVAQPIMPAERNPKLAVMLEEIESCLEAGEQVIVWARFQEELQQLARVFSEQKKEDGSRWRCVEYHGEIGSKTARQEAIDSFESGTADIFLSQQQAGGTGLTLIARASLARSMTVIYYSNTFALEDRVQSEDRAHRIGQSKTVRYVDVCSEDSLDSEILAALKNKTDIAAMITGDARRAAKLLGLTKAADFDLAV